MTVWNPEKFFTALPAFREAAPENLRRMAWRSKRVAFNKDEFIFQEGGPAEAAWWVSDGYVKIAKTTPQGRLVTMEMLVSGDGFGLAGIMRFEDYPANAIAVTPCAAVRVPAEELAAVARAHPAVTQNVLGQVSQRLQRAHRLRALDAESAEKRVAAALLWVCEKSGPEISISRKEISEIAGVAPETAIRVVLDFKEKNWLSATARSMTLRRPEELESLVDRTE